MSNRVFRNPCGVIDNWHPISTAPKDGTWIVVLIPESIQSDEAPRPLVETVRWVSEERERWEFTDNSTMKKVLDDTSHWSNYEEPSHWMPRPGESA
jgi:hypothetical protein